MRLCTAAEMVALDQGAIRELGIPGAVLMENAGRACCRYFEQEFAELFPGPVLIVCGKGNNGGDGYVMARILADRGWQVHTLVLAPLEDIGGDARIMLEVARAMNLPVAAAGSAAAVAETIGRVAPRVIVDAIFGTGLSSDVRGLQREAIEEINASAAKVFAVDIPSGVDGSTGRVCGVAVQADLTVTFAEAKIGHGSQPGAECAGRLQVVDIGIPVMGRADFASRVSLIVAEDAVSLLPERPGSGHKGTFGHTLIVAGSPGKTGAAALAGNAAARSGCGLVTVATPAAVHDIIEVKLTEAMSAPLPADDDGLLSRHAVVRLGELMKARQALAVGPGLGQSAGLIELLCWMIEHAEVPVVIDADGLNLLAGCPDIFKVAPRAPLILTPHPGEMARLSGLSIAEIQANRFEVARDFAREHDVVLLLKGLRTVVAAPDGRVNINSSGNDALASGGSGDVLTGIISGLVAQGLDGFEAASLGVWLHGRSAELAAEQLGSAGVIASDLISYLPQARRELVKGACLC